LGKDAGEVRERLNGIAAETSSPKTPTTAKYYRLTPAHIVFTLLLILIPVANVLVVAGRCSIGSGR